MNILNVIFLPYLKPLNVKEFWFCVFKEDGMECIYD